VPVFCVVVDRCCVVASGELSCLGCGAEVLRSTAREIWSELRSTPLAKFELNVCPLSRPRRTMQARSSRSLRRSEFEDKRAWTVTSTFANVVVALKFEGAAPAPRTNLHCPRTVPAREQPSSGPGELTV
jgi:hypothetical protein